MNRRDFLFLRTSSRGRTLELSCRVLFMRFVDSQLEPGDDSGWEPGMGEPPAVVSRTTASELMAQLERDLEDVEILQVREPEWLASDARLASMVDAATGAFRARGGLVETVRPSSATT